METEIYNEQPALHLNFDSRDFLESTAKWGKFLAIIGFIFFGIMIVGGLGGILLTMKGGSVNLGNSLMSGGVFSLFYLALALLYFFPLLYLHRFSTKMLAGLEQNDEAIVTHAFKNLKSLFKLLGILTIVMLAIYVFVVISATAGAYFGSSRF